MKTDEPNKPRRRRHCADAPDEVFQRARKHVVDEKLFLDPYLTLDMLAAGLNVHRNTLSAAVNRYAGVIFPVWIANFRLAEVERLALLPENRDASLESIAKRAGFANRTSFYRVYRSIRKSRPAETLRRIMN